MQVARLGCSLQVKQDNFRRKTSKLFSTFIRLPPKLNCLTVRSLEQRNLECTEKRLLILTPSVYLMAKVRVAYEYSEAEDKTIRLGFFLIVAGIISLFILGFCWLNPTLNSLQCKAANCTVVSLRQIGEMSECTFTCGADCKGTSLYPCLQIFVNNSQSNSRALLHYDEKQLLLNPKCSYIPPCERDNQKNSENVMSWHDYWKEEIGSQSFICYINRQRRPDDVLLKRARDENVLMHCMLWPLLTLLVGVLIVLLTVCGKSLAIRAEALQKMKYS